MDDLDRLFQRLVYNIRNGHAEYLSVPFTVQELYDTLVPYRHYRRDLGIETNQDYEAAVTRLLSGEKGYVRADKAMQDRLKKELESPHADVGAFRDYAETRISLAPDALQKCRDRAWGAELANQIDRANVDSQFQRCRGHRQRRLYQRFGARHRASRLRRH